ncbi:hypothetical protein [Marinobacterium rhizophilum]|uniref:Pyridoxamine 5'-phosphate oxidase putative domain-containing protein n=1 Tax=Marinobacterium rhizophilum TaxID=420402 RepID=A0ABY5HPZ9_9GAMM|nr:hypothetical protein [Marinobacterium rhizophilum]UTW12966.1 hypothetical protein KDW95_04635 [Marinobacterium rhizophilum]
MNANSGQKPLDPALASFVTSQLSIVVAACSDAGESTLAWALGARVTSNRQRLTVLIPASQARDLLQCIGANGSIAVVFNEPDTHQTVQIKGADARAEPLLATDKASLEPYISCLARRLQRYQVPEAFSRAFYSADPDDLVAVSFSPSAAYGQTPGPHAGEPLQQEGEAT